MEQGLPCGRRRLDNRPISHQPSGISDHSSSYRLLDSGSFSKLEQVGPFRLVRPSPSATWKPELTDAEWTGADAAFERYNDGNGSWNFRNRQVREPWTIEAAGLRFVIKPTSFGHIGLFPEQRDNWVQLHDLIAARRAARPDDPVRVLNLFAYTGGSTLACARAGAEVAHVDASKGSVNWARENAAASGLGDRPVRWLVDDVQAFVERERRRGNRYQGIILDPPSYGRGSRKQVWKIEEHLTGFLAGLAELAADDLLFVLLSCHTPGYTPVALRNQLAQMLGDRAGHYEPAEMLIESEAVCTLPSGASCLFATE